MPIELKQTPILEFPPPSRRFQILSELVSCDGEYDDGLNYCLITLDAVQISRILDAHRDWRRVFPNALELVIKDSEHLAEYLTGDEEETVSVWAGSEFQIVEGEPVTLTEDDNASDAWQIQLRKIIVRETDVRFAAVYEASYILQNAFTISGYIPIRTLEELLEKSIAGDISDAAEQAH